MVLVIVGCLMLVYVCMYVCMFLCDRIVIVDIWVIFVYIKLMDLIIICYIWN